MTPAGTMEPSTSASDSSVKDFHHPFRPYQIQQEFMEAMYACIEEGQVGIFESPTGTGKSLSLICGSLTWLREHKRKLYDESIAAIEVDADEPEWLVEHTREIKRREMRQMRAEFEDRLKAVRERERKLRERHVHGERPSKRRKRMVDESNETDADEERYVLDGYDSGEEGNIATSTSSQYSAETTKLLERLGMLLPIPQAGTNQQEADELKVYFCSRTHSQLSQFVGELKRVELPTSLPNEPSDDSTGDGQQVAEQLKQLSLGSRKNLCINPKVMKLESQTAINERCIELQQSSTSAEHRCPYLPTKENEDVLLDFRDHALAQIRDIEDLASVGAKVGICPYYASRPAITSAEMVTLPYPLLLQKSARDALGISLKGHVVVIDEAHNLMNAIEGIYSTQISETQLKRSRDALIVYLQRFRNRLKGSNRVHVTQVVRVVDSMLLFFASIGTQRETAGILNAEELLKGKGVDQVNLSKLVRYINDSKLARKVEGYIASIQRESDESGAKAFRGKAIHDVPNLTNVQNFLSTLMNPSKEGRFFWSREAENSVVRYMLLDPSQHFREVVEDARAVILAGGTMSPMEDYKQQLFPYLPSFRTFSCGHLVPPTSLLVRTVAADPDGPLEFSFKSRNDASATRIGETLSKISPSVRGGLVVFFPSYGFLEEVATCWRHDGLHARMAEMKPIFYDSRGTPAEETFKAYSQAIETGQKGAIMFSVIGGKLSEGINFADDLGRCVIVVGLPFPNLQTPEWKAKIQYIDDKFVAAGGSRGKAGREHAENVCMRAVNQAIGRVIRHKDDWASILLMDRRYYDERIRSKLPGWINASVRTDVSMRVDDVTKDIHRFFEEKSKY